MQIVEPGKRESEIFVLSKTTNILFKFILLKQLDICLNPSNSINHAGINVWGISLFPTPSRLIGSNQRIRNEWIFYISCCIQSTESRIRIDRIPSVRDDWSNHTIRDLKHELYTRQKLMCALKLSWPMIDHVIHDRLIGLGYRFSPFLIASLC